MIPPQVLILADDLTGAADTAGVFARAGFPTLVRFAPGPEESAQVLALSTHSRHLSPARAAQAQRRALADQGEAAKATWIYKKIDSTLRGQPAAELQALMEAMGETRALIAPAFPQQGRTTVRARQRVDGLLLEETSFGGNSDLRQVFSRPGIPLRHLDLEGVRRGAELGAEGLCVADAEQEEDLRCLVRGARAARVRLLCGSAGLARALREILPQPASAPVCPARSAGPVLVVAGSRHPATLRQVQALGEAGGLVLGLEDEISPALRVGGTVVFSSTGPDLGDPEAVAARLARMAREILSDSQAGGLVLTGGDIALAVCTALESTGMWLHGEVEPGIPWGVLADGPWADLRVATKAGGFGGEGALVEAVEQLRRGS